MADQEYMHPSSGSLEAQFSEMKAGNAGLYEKLEDYIVRIERYIKAAPKVDSCKFNKMQCEHLVLKLEVLVERTRSFLNVDLVHGPCLSVMAEKWVETFKLMLTLANQIKDFVQSCCKNEWIQAAMTMTNTSEYVSSLGFNVELCNVICEGFLEGRKGPGSSTTVELQGRISKTEAEIVEKMRKLRKGFTWADLDNMYRTEVEIVKVRAEVDLRTLSHDVTSELSSLEGETKDLAIFLLQILSRVQSRPTKDDWSILGFLCELVIPVDKKLGSGATGSVYAATWLGMPVAKKVFEGLDNPYFNKEVLNLAPLRHPNITSMFCCKKTNRDSCIIMELMDGDLCTLLHNKRNRGEENSGSSPFPILEAVDIMLQMGQGVNYLHNNKMVHRDLKPQNILVKSVKAELDFGYIHAKVTDFGLSHTKDCSARLSTLQENVGSNRYMPPEVINLTPSPRKSPSKSDSLLSFPFKCDTYSYGMVCYEILTGHVPFHEERDEKRLKENVKKGDRPELRGDLPPMLKALIERCWSGDPKDRPRFDLVCSQLRYLKYLLITGADKETHESAATEFEAAAREARKKDDAREQEAAAKLREKAANDSRTQEARDAQAKEHELELKAAAAKEALEHRASLKDRAKAALLAHRQSRPPFEKPTEDQRLAAMERIQYEQRLTFPNSKFQMSRVRHIAVCGVSGSGKSSLINAFRGLNRRDEGAARVGVTETTLEVTRYPDPRNEYPYSHLVWYDIPGAGTAAVSYAQYFEKQGLFVFDMIILVYSDRFTNVDIDIIENCSRLRIPIVIVRSKADQHIDNMIKDEADCSTDDDDEDQSYEDMKAKYIDATNSDFNMHKEIMAELVFNLEGDSWLQRSLSVLRVYNVCARNVGSLMAQARVAKGRGLPNNKIAAKMFDEALLIEQILNPVKLKYKIRAPF